MPFVKAWRALAATFIVVLCALAVPAQAQLPVQDLRPVPALTAHVIDQTGTLSAADRQALEQQLSALETAHGSQVVVLLVPSTAPEDIASFANRVGNSWKIGRRGVGDGVLIVVAKDDRRMRIEVAKALEGAIPDIAAARIIDTLMKPRFRAGDYTGGLQAAVQEIAARIAGEPLPAPAQEDAQGDAGLDLGMLLVLLFVLVSVGGGLLRALFGTTVGALLTGAAAGVVTLWLSASLLLAVVMAVLGFFFALALAARGGVVLGPPGGWGGGWGGGLGGGGFRSGGGGDFGGGGASGDW